MVGSAGEGKFWWGGSGEKLKMRWEWRFTKRGRFKSDICSKMGGHRV